MALTWSTIGSVVNGDFSYYINKTNLSLTYVDIQIVASSLKWENFDIEFEYRKDSDSIWKKDAYINFTSANSVNKNRVYGLKTSQYGYTNSIRWTYSRNNIKYGRSIQVRVKILPRIRNFSLSIINSSITEGWGISGANLKQLSIKKCIGINNSGKYICITDTELEIYNTLQDSSPLYSYTLLNNPVYAIQVDSGNYIVCDYGNNRVLELDETLSTLINTFAINTPIFVDYNNVNNLTLITSYALNEIKEVSLDFGTTSWTSALSLLTPRSATYSYNDADEIIISDFGNNRIIITNKVTSATLYKDSYYIKTGCEKFKFYQPYRAYKFNDTNVLIIEKTGKIVDFTYAPEFMSSSSSSYSSSSFSSYSSSSNSSNSSSTVEQTSSSSNSSSSDSSSSNSSSSISSSSSSSSSTSSSSTWIRSTSSSSSSTWIRSSSSSLSSTSSSSTWIRSTSSSSSPSHSTELMTTSSSSSSLSSTSSSTSSSNSSSSSLSSISEQSSSSLEFSSSSSLSSDSSIIVSHSSSSSSESAGNIPKMLDENGNIVTDENGNSIAPE